MKNPQVHVSYHLLTQFQIVGQLMNNLYKKSEGEYNQSDCDVYEILTIPLMRLNKIYEGIWRFDAIRVHIVESAYKVCVRHLIIINWYELKVHGDWICSWSWLIYEDQNLERMNGLSNRAKLRTRGVDYLIDPCDLTFLKINRKKLISSHLSFHLWLPVLIFY